jgi:thiamine biosynthesis lipoprotein
MRANAHPGRWHDVPAECARAVRAAGRAHRETRGLFDPRVLDVLLRLGYDRTLPFERGGLTLDTTASGGPVPEQPARPEWKPRVDCRAGQHRIHLDGTAIDLGGIGKGLAARWAWEELRKAGESIMVDAGGDCRFSGPGPEGEGWRVGVEDPRGGTDPVAVLVLTDTGCATSSVRVRHWRVAGKPVHHLIDPRTGESGGDGLLSVSVVHPDPARAEVWSKSLFLCGASGIAAAAADHSLAALWVCADGTLGISDAAEPFVLWAASDG